MAATDQHREMDLHSAKPAGRRRHVRGSHTRVCHSWVCHRSGGRSRSLKAWRFLLLVCSLMVFVAACADDEPELTMAERLAAVEGRELSPAELADRLAVGETLCGMGDEVLDEIWRQLNERQLNYQDVVFGHICPDRSVFYASLTGRYVTDEAEESGVVPSTTRPPITTIAPSTTAALSTTAAPSITTATNGDGGETTSPQGTETATSVDTSGSTTTTAATETSTTAETSATTAPTTTATTVIATTTSSPAEGEGG